MFKFLLTVFILIFITSKAGLNYAKKIGDSIVSDELLKALQSAKQLDEQQEEENKVVRNQEVDDFLKVIGHIESSGGKNFNHDEIKSGIHQGHRAAGTYGLMPNTIDEILNRMRMSGQVDSELSALGQMAPDEKKRAVETNPELEQRLARSLADRVLSKQDEDEEKAAYSWFQGHNMSPERIEQDNYKDHDYVKKYNKIKKLIGG